MRFSSIYAVKSFGRETNDSKLLSKWISSYIFLQLKLFQEEKLHIHVSNSKKLCRIEKHESCNNFKKKILRFSFIHNHATIAGSINKNQHR